MLWRFQLFLRLAFETFVRYVVYSFSVFFLIRLIVYLIVTLSEKWGNKEDRAKKECNVALRANLREECALQFPESVRDEKLFYLWLYVAMVTYGIFTFAGNIYRFFPINLLVVLPVIIMVFY